MSAYLCDADTFDYLATAASVLQPASYAIAYGKPSMPDVTALLSEGVIHSRDPRIAPSEPNAIAAILRHQNVRSIQARYPSDWSTMLPDTPAPYTFRRVNRGLIDPATVLKSCACLEYQSCESDDYRDTLAYAVLEGIRSAAIHALTGYEEAPWGWTRADVKAAR